MHGLAILTKTSFLTSFFFFSHKGDSLDIAVANAGINPLDVLVEVKDLDVDKLANVLDVNTLSLIKLFNAVHPLLKATVESKGEGAAKLVALSS